VLGIVAPAAVLLGVRWRMVVRVYVVVRVCSMAAARQAVHLRSGLLVVHHPSCGGDGALLPSYCLVMPHNARGFHLEE
jgi:hypothetical protein